MNHDNFKFVEFEYYCEKCKHRYLNENEDPCDICLECPARFHTKKPLYFKEADC